MDSQLHALIGSLSGHFGNRPLPEEATWLPIFWDSLLGGLGFRVLGGPWELVTTYNRENRRNL